LHFAAQRVEHGRTGRNIDALEQLADVDFVEDWHCLTGKNDDEA
jgi:hypothetical protein